MSQSSHKWIKVWTTILTDPDIDNTSLEDIGRWVKLLLYVKMHGDGGVLKIAEPAKTFCFHMQVSDVNQFKSIAEKLPNIQVSCNGKNGVTIFSVKNWSKYQIDDSYERVLKYRNSVTPQDKNKNKIRIREDKKRKDKNISAFVLPDFVPQKEWEGYEEMRKTIKKPLTDKARILAVNELQKFKDQGYDPKAILNQSILNSWQGLFEPRKNKKDDYL